MHILKPDHFSQRLILATSPPSLRPIQRAQLNGDRDLLAFDPLKKSPDLEHQDGKSRGGGGAAFQGADLHFNSF